VSWTQVRAITRVATAADEQTYVELARHASGAQLDRLVRGVRRAQKIVEDEADPQAAAYRMRTRVSYDADGTLVLSVRLPAEQGAVLLAALEQARALLDRQAGPSSAEDPTNTGATANDHATAGAGPATAAASSAEDWAGARRGDSDRRGGRGRCWCPAGRIFRGRLGGGAGPPGAGHPVGGGHALGSLVSAGHRS